MATPEGHSFPASHVLQLVTLAERWGIDAAELLAGSGVSPSELDSPATRISTAQLIALSERTRALTGEPGIGFYLGVQKRLTSYGFVGFAAMSASTVREAIELFVRYSPTITTAVALELAVSGDTAHLFIDERADLGTAHDIGLFSLLVGMRTLTSALTGHEASGVSVDVPLARPAYFARFQHLLPSARFGQLRAAYHFPAAGLEARLVAPDRAALALAREACERDLAQLGFDRSLGARVKRLAITDDGFLRIDAVARALHLSTRTLKRRLTEEGVSYSGLLDDERHKRACAMLAATELPLEEIAHQLDYSSFANFARAFRRWTSESPAQFRRRARGGAGL
jgi:AraC-like DNA-binding protein